jgi:hypothetical protein
VDKTTLSDTEKERVAIYSDNCFECRHLVPSKTKKFSSCHFTKGNPHCPAQGVLLVVVGKAYRYAQQVLQARTARDAEAEGRILAVVAKQSPEFQERFYAALENPSEIIE